MKRILVLMMLILGIQYVSCGQGDKINVIVFGAHPDDPDGDAGTAIKFASMGHNVMFVSLTNGDAGHQSMGGGALAKIRREEAAEAGKRYGIKKYITLDNHDGELLPTLEVRHQVIRLIREWDADVVIGPRPNDYHPDHRYTGVVLQDAAYMVIVPNVASDTPPLEKNPVFLYTRDHFQKPNPFNPEIAVDISDVYEKKIFGMAAHESQFFDWLPWTVGRLEEVPEGGKERLDWLAKTWSDEITPGIRSSLAKWYGADRAAKVTHAETFEICEYGRRPSDEEIRKLFPMLGK
ncbi:MAG: PIG-L family deacetylase [Cyclobacteriaceae bacterium]|nr:PIG-L family deacetylase [Cyclobacteriaceae bacterium]